ncbi:MAG: tRNA 2-thiouridine(34) synthase MnmA [Patescibacteria group bacterium]
MSLKQNKKKIKVLVALSGGVDSSVAAALLLRQGYDVTGAFIKNWSDTKDVQSGECQWRGERRDAMRVAATLGIQFLTFDFEKQYRRLVVKALYDGYAAGLTPNPDVLCNEYVKFGLFWDKAKKLGFDMMATGHYAIVKNSKLYRGKDPDKDQSYFLYRIKHEALAHTFFPIGNITKSQVRSLAKKFKLPVADKPDSQGICFIGKVDFGDFLSKKIKSKPGEIVTPEGEVIGQHQGLHNYTIGQRHKIKVADNHAWYVADKDVKNNRLVVVDSEDHPWLLAKQLVLGDLHWIKGKPPKASTKVLIQARYRQKPVPGVLRGIDSNKATIALKAPIKAAALGQSAVVYQGQECLGGGVIRSIKRAW